MDTGCSFSLLKRSFARVLGLTGPPHFLRLAVAGGHIYESHEREVMFRLMSLDGSYTTHPIPAITAKTISEPLPPVKLEPRHFPEIADLNFTYEYPQTRPQPVDLLLASSIVYELQKGDVIQCPTDIGPRAVRYLIGDALCGSYLVEGDGKKRAKMAKPVVFTGTAEEISPDPFNSEEIKNFIRLEQLGISNEEESEMTLAETEAVELFNSSIKYDEKGKFYTVKLLWKDDPKIHLDDNIGRALAVCQAARRRINKDPELDKLVSAAYLEQYNLKMATIVPKEEWKPDYPCYTMPSRPVYKDSSSSTPIRIVLDASANCRTTNKSLNHLLHRGPSLLPDVAKLMLRFRMHKYVVLTDCSKMFWRVHIAEEDRPFLRYMWKFNEDDDPILFQSIVSCFGLNDSPFKSMAVVHHHCNKFMLRFEKGAKAILASLYMDDASAAHDDDNELAEIASQMFALFNLGGFPTHKWVSNDPKILAAAKIPDEVKSDKKIQKFLGLTWDTEKDEICYSYNHVLKFSGEKSTKRKMLSELSSVYDVLGMVSPWTMKAKILFQKLWSFPDLGWDGELPDDIEAEWQEWREEARKMVSITLPRLCANPDEPKWLACFSDGSSAGFSCALYCVGKNEARLIFAKAKVAPTKTSEKEKGCKPLSIARMELLGCLISSRAASYVLSAFPPGYFYKTRYFVDSLITYYRVKNDYDQYKVWVARRLEEIQKKAGADNFFFCAGNLNPSDCNSRNMPVGDLTTNLLWFHGPPFLLRPENEWPAKKSLSPAEAAKILRGEYSEAEEAEKKKDAVATAVLNAQIFKIMRADAGSWVNRVISHYREWRKIITATTYYQRLILHLARKTNNSRLVEKIAGVIVSRGRAIRSPRFHASNSANNADEEEEEKQIEMLTKRLVERARVTSYFSLNERRSAECFWFRVAQKIAFPKVFADPNNMELYYDLEKYSAKFDKVGLIRSVSRLELSSTMPKSAVYPVILPKNSELTQKFVLDQHAVYGHMPKSHTYYHIKMIAVLVGGRNECNKILRKCTNWVCNPPRMMQQRMAPLPSVRVDNYITFEYAMIDFMGPFEVEHRYKHYGKTRKDVRKCYVSVMTCLYCRAVALELCENMTTETLLESFDRMFARTGTVSVLFSDNFKSYQKADRYLTDLFKRIDRDDIISQMGRKGIEWKFGIERAAWSQGAVEVMIKLCKGTLNRILNNHPTNPRPTPQQFTTMLLRCEAWMNDRPLGATLDEKNSIRPLTPSMLIRGRQLGSLPQEPLPLTEIPEKEHLTRMMAHRAHLQNEMWRTWQQEYLLKFQVGRLLASQHMPKLEVGMLLLLRDKKFKVNTWMIVKVIKLFPGTDGRIRRVEIETTKGTKLMRHVNDLAFLEWDIPAPVINEEGRPEAANGRSVLPPADAANGEGERTDRPTGPWTRSKQAASDAR